MKTLKKLTLFSLLKIYSINKNYKIINFKKPINNVKESYIDILNNLNFWKNKIIIFANKKDVKKTFTLIIKTYILV